MSDSNPGEGKERPRTSLFGRARQSASASAPPPPRKEPKRKEARNPARATLSSLSGLLTFVLLGAVVAIGAVAWLMMESGKPGPLAENRVVNIVREDDGGSIADQLERAGVIDSAIWFNLLTLFDGNRAALKRGEYEFKAGDSLRQVEATVMSGKVVLHPLTIPEGLTSEQVVQRVRDAEFLAGGVKEVPREGSILPETYDYPRGFTRQAVLTRMEKQQAKLVDEIWRRRSPDLPIKSPGEMVTLASIVEKETGKPDERPKVAGVFVNRLQKHMRLESDPTIVYGLVFGKGTLGHPITKDELNRPTPYNTYLIDGLPPGPISNPGKAALEAVANPVRSRDLYFVADGTGGHVFAETFEQHQKNVAHWRQIEKDAKDRLAPDVTPQPAPAIHGGADPVDPASFGTLVALASPQIAPAAAVVARLAQIGAGRKAMAFALDSLSPTAPGAKSIEELGAVVAGVNDAPADGDAFAQSDAPGASPDGVASVPLSPAMLADQKAREAKYGTAQVSEVSNAAATSTVGQAAPAAQPATSSGRPRIYDASEGTRLDPLLNKTYDLSYAKVVPDLH
jgi:UPF0755 protein